jgi:hypothetical protein
MLTHLALSLQCVSCFNVWSIFIEGINERHIMEDIGETREVGL